MHGFVLETKQAIAVRRLVVCFDRSLFLSIAWLHFAVLCSIDCVVSDDIGLVAIAATFVPRTLVLVFYWKINW